MLPDEMAGKTMFVAHSERDWRFLVNLWRPGGSSRGSGPM